MNGGQTSTLDGLRVALKAFEATVRDHERTQDVSADAYRQLALSDVVDAAVALSKSEPVGWLVTEAGKTRYVAQQEFIRRSYGAASFVPVWAGSEALAKGSSLEEGDAEVAEVAVESQAGAAHLGGSEKAALFFIELLDACESLQGIAEEFGQRTFTDMMYLQNAILTGQQIDVWPGETRVGEVLGKLPSSDLWMGYTKLGGVWAEACERVAV